MSPLRVLLEAVAELMLIVALGVVAGLLVNWLFHLILDLVRGYEFVFLALLLLGAYWLCPEKENKE